MVGADGQGGSRRFCVIYVGRCGGPGQEIVAADVSVVELNQVVSSRIPVVYVEHDQPVSKVRVNESLDKIS